MSYDFSSAFESASIERELTESGNIIGELDIFIAGIARSNNLPVLSIDSDFNRVRGLKVINLSDISS